MPDMYGNVMGIPQGYNPYGGYNPYAMQGYPATMPGAYNPMLMGGYNQPQQKQPQTGADILSGLMKSGAAANYNFQGTNLAPQQSIASEMGNLANAQYDTSNPLYQQVYNNENQSAKQDLASAIAEAGRQNQKLSMLGRTPLFSNERGGEQMFRQTVQGYQTAQDTARQRARQILGAGQTAQNNAFQAQGSIAQQQNQNQQKKAFGFGNIADVLPLLAKLF